VKGLVYVIALAPDEGEAVANVFYKDDPRPKAPKLAPDKNGLIWLPEDAFASAFARHASSEERCGACRSPATNPAGLHYHKSWKASGEEPSNDYLVAQEDRMIIGKTQASWRSA
jgi:hypothetical protein